MQDEIERLIDEWHEAKLAESDAQSARRSIEDRIAALVDLKLDADGTTAVCDRLKITTRLNHTVDADLAQEIAAENGMDAMLTTLFRWKPALSIREWRSADESIRSAFAPAITTKAARPTFQLKEKS